jgi:predicted Zn-dependent protease
MAAESAGDMEQSVRANRKLLESRVDDPDLQNNLAYALLERGKADDLPEARRLIEAALARHPSNSTYLDTLARVHLKARDLPAAEQTFERALEARGDSVEALIGLADVHVQAGRPKRARELLVRINNALPAGSALPTSLQRQLETVRQSVSGSLESGRIE